jgi:hypothetical protein
VHLEDGVSGTLHPVCFSFMDKFFYLSTFFTPSFACRHSLFTAH